MCFENPDHARAAIEAMNGKVEDGFTWFVAVHMNKRQRQAKLRQENLKKQEEWKKRNVYVRGLPPGIDEEKSRILFQEYGEIESIKIPTVENIRYVEGSNEMIKEFSSKGVAYILFIQAQSASRAIQGMRDKSVEARKLFVAL